MTAVDFLFDHQGLSLSRVALCNATEVQSALDNPANKSVYNLPITVRLYRTSKVRGRPDLTHCTFPEKAKL